MLHKILQNKTTIFFTILMISLLLLIRAFESQLFYDPFLSYFEQDYINKPLPEFNTGLLFFGLLFRFSLNTIFSLGLLYFIFKDREIILLVAIFYVLLFVILIVAFFFVLYFFKNQENLPLFYLRRFLIQPLFVFVFIPAFYFQKLEKPNSRKSKV